MSEAGFNDDFLEKELFGGDDDGLDGASMDVDDMMLTGQSVVAVEAELASAAAAAAAAAVSGNGVSEDDSRARLERPRELHTAKLDIAMDDPPGELTL
ncbi:hypothetical protein GGI19_005525, partial [Coemansia pectinata]